MKKTVFRYGLYSAITISTILLMGWTLGKNLGFSSQEIIGYASIIISTSFAYFAIKHYRDEINNGYITFGKALLIGILVVLFASTAFAIVDYLYTTVINPSFKDEYLRYTINTMKTELPAEEFEVKKAELIAQMNAYTPALMALHMFFTVFIIGFIISLLSSLILQRKLS